MRVTIEYLRERHKYWIEEIGKAGIWNTGLFQPVNIGIRNNHRRYNALFQRKTIRKGLSVTYVDTIVIYRKSDDFDPVYLDSLLVHEMIHQYLMQNGLSGPRPHGEPFRSLMKRINHSFPGRLNIQLKSQNPSVAFKGEGEDLHKLLFVSSGEKTYCCVIHPSKTEEFDKKIKRLVKRGGIKNYFRGESRDMFFNNVTRCVTALHGIPVNTDELDTFCREYNIRILP